jgi:alpha-glucosidase
LNKYKILKEQGADISGVWVQDWVGKRESLGYSRLWWNWELDTKHYSNWESFRQQLKGNGVQILTYINPMLTDATSKPNLNKNYYKIAS